MATVKMHFLRYKLMGHPEVELEPIENPETAKTVQGKLGMVYGPLLEKSTLEVRECRVDIPSSSEQPALDPELRVRTATMTKAQREELRRALDEQDSGKSEF